MWTQRAVSDLEAFGDYIAADDETAAHRWVTRLIDLAERLVSTPELGRHVPELGREDVREVFLRQYRLVYRLDERQIVVLTIFEGHREFPGVLEDEDQSP